MMKYLIGELAKKSQVSVDSIRFYEKRGVLKAPHAQTITIVTMMIRHWIN